LGARDQPWDEGIGEDLRRGVRWNRGSQ
jgi:hypothetical protein